MYQFDEKLNHSASHVLAKAILELWPNAKLTLGPAIDEGFYYDIDFGNDTFSEKDFGKVKKTMQKIIDQNLEFYGQMKPRKELEEIYQNNPFKLEILKSLEGDEFQVVYTGDKFFDLCKGGHVKKTKEIKAFDLLKTSAVYWRADAKNPSLTRIYGVAFDSKDQLKAYQEVLEYRKKYDHRKTGTDLCMFTFDPLIGVGLPVWLENGYISRTLICEFINQIQINHGVDMVKTPVLGSKELYETSGHWYHYKENMFPAIKVENTEYVLRPMTCPHHIVLYKQHQWSYKQLPKIYGENALLHRYEYSGGLTGLERVRSMELIDTHAFCSPDKIEAVITKFYQMIKLAADGLDFKFHRVDLSLRSDDKTKFFDDDQIWESSQKQLKDVLNKLNIEYVEMPGEAAFYGPKIDFQMETMTKKISTIGTIQLDFLLPKKFDLTFKNKEGNFETPVMIHLGIIGTLERFFALFLEQSKGILPFWLMPTQVVLIPVDNASHYDKCLQLQQELLNNNIRVVIDDKDERLGKKIRHWQTSKVPYQIVIGDNELQNNESIVYRAYGEKENVCMNWQEFLKSLVAKNKMPKTK